MASGGLSCNDGLSSVGTISHGCAMFSLSSGLQAIDWRRKRCSCLVLQAIRGRLHLAIDVGGGRKSDVLGKGSAARTGEIVGLEAHE